MIKKLFLTITLFSCILGYSQEKITNYKVLASKKGSNYFTIIEQMRSEFANKDLSILRNKKAKKHFERWAYFWKNRINQDGTFPNENTGYFSAGILDTNGKIKKTPSVTTQKNITSPLNDAAWINIGPQQQNDINNNGYPNYPQMGRLNVLLRIPHPTDMNQDVLFVGAPNGGIWKSTDGGSNWTPKLDFIAGIGITDIKTSPSTTFANYTTQPIYVSTGDYDGGNVKAIGVLKSTDGGETFNSTGLSYTIDQQKSLSDLVVVDNNTVFVGDNLNILKTIDGGVNWSIAYSSGATDNIDFGRVANTGNEIMFIDYFGDIYYTDDYTDDANWISISGNTNEKTTITLDDSNDFYIQNEVGQIQKFNKTSKTFSNFGNIPPGYDSQAGFNQTLLISNGLMISCGVNGNSSSNNGNNWSLSLNGYWNDNSSPGNYVHSDHHKMGKLDENLSFWSVNDGGLNYVTYASVNDTKPTVTYKSEKVIVTQSYTVAINPNANDGALMMANQDNDTFSKRNGTWFAVSQGDGIQSAINYNDSDIRYAANQNGIVSQTDTGFEGELGGNGNNLTVPGANFYFPMEMHKTNPEILYAGGNEVYKLDASSFGFSISNTNSGLSGSVVTIATHGNSVIAATNSDIKFSNDQGTTWDTVSTSGINGGNITSLDYDATNNNIIYATVGGYSAGNKVFKTTDGGVNWTNISGSLPNIVVNEIMLKQGQSSEYLFLATGLGVYFTEDGGTTWAKLGQNMPNVDVRDIEIHYTADKLVAGTFGRGLWEVSLSESTLSTNDIESDELKITLYPNPVTKDLFILVPGNDFKYTIYNVVGGLVKTGFVTNQAINVSNLASNIYMVRIYNNSTSITKKIVVE